MTSAASQPSRVRKFNVGVLDDGRTTCSHMVCSLDSPRGIQSPESIGKDRATWKWRSSEVVIARDTSNLRKSDGSLYATSFATRVTSLRLDR